VDMLLRDLALADLRVGQRLTQPRHADHGDTDHRNLDGIWISRLTRHCSQIEPSVCASYWVPGHTG